MQETAKMTADMIVVIHVVVMNVVIHVVAMNVVIHAVAMNVAVSHVILYHHVLQKIVLTMHLSTNSSLPGWLQAA